MAAVQRTLALSTGRQWTARRAPAALLPAAVRCRFYTAPAAPGPDGTTAGTGSPAAPTTPAAAFPDFVPRTSYEPSTDVPRSYFIGHHRAALDRMRGMLATVGLVIECRDLRVPLTASNPLLDTSLGGRRTNNNTDDTNTGVPGLAVPASAGGGGSSLLSPSDPDDRARIIVYTKRDLVVDPATPGVSPSPADLRRLAAFHEHEADAVVFLGQDGSSGRRQREMAQLLAAVRAVARRHSARSLTSLRALVVGMPNAGKSTLLNRLRAAGMADAGRRSKVAATGAQPGVTRKLGTPVRILGDDEEENDGGVLVVDTPGVFVPYVADAEAMLRLALVGSVREALVPPVALADFLLHQLNRRDPGPYVAAYRLPAPTHDIHALLDAVARRTGKLGRGAAPLHEAAALHLVHAFRRGRLGRFCLDPLDPDALAAARDAARHAGPLSMHQARKRDKERRKARSAAKFAGDDTGVL